eukprot:scaffold8152_cov113-Isochrysis_galbana.AAC.3
MSGFRGAPEATSSASAWSASASSLLYVGLLSTTDLTMSGSRRLTVSWVKPPSVARSGSGSVEASMLIRGAVTRNRSAVGRSSATTVEHISDHTSVLFSRRVEGGARGVCATCDPLPPPEPEPEAQAPAPPAGPPAQPTAHAYLARARTRAKLRGERKSEPRARVANASVYSSNTHTVWPRK